MGVPTQLSIYNGALRKLEERQLASVTENRESRRYLDEAYPDLIQECLEDALWSFARKTVKLTPDAEYTAEFGRTYRFTEPDDFIRTHGMYYDDRMVTPIVDYETEKPYFYCDEQQLFLSYISLTYGSDFSRWTKSFGEYVEFKLAMKIRGRLSNSNVSYERLKSEFDDAFSVAKSNSAMENPTTFPPTGRWATARRGNGYRRDRGSRGRLIG